MRKNEPKQLTDVNAADRYFEARDANSGITLSISRNDDGSPQVSYTGRGGATGICQVSSRGAPAPATNSARPGDAGTGSRASSSFPARPCR